MSFSSEEDVLEQIIDKCENAIDENELTEYIKSIEDPTLRFEMIERYRSRLQLLDVREFVHGIESDARIDFSYDGAIAYDANKKRIKFPLSLIVDNDDLPVFENANFDYFNEEIGINSLSNYINQSDEEWYNIIKFANAMGCFSDKKIRNRNGRESKTVVGQKATMALRDMIKTGNIRYKQFYDLFDDMPMDIEFNQGFLNFISHRAYGKKYDNLKMLIDLESEYRGIEAKTVSQFAKVKKYRTALDGEGKPTTIPWIDAVVGYYKGKNYKGVNVDNEDIAEVFSQNNIDQNTFNVAAELRDRAIDEGAPEHVLGVPIREETIMDDIERVKRGTSDELADGFRLINDLYDKMFTYEWLDKYDPRNNIIGIFASCCATVVSNVYGKNIVDNTLIMPDLQNLVVRDIYGEIIAKGTAYIDEWRGYAVINDFEINQEYKDHETKKSGVYRTDENSPDEQRRQKIFDAFMRGIEAFAREYDKKHPDHPLEQVNVGMGHNKLKRQVQKFKKATHNLYVPIEYDFQDAESEQYILYERDSRTVDEGGTER